MSEYYPQLANAEEAGEFSACDEALIKYFSQSEDIILNSVTTPRMIKTSATEPETNPTQAQTDPTDPTASAETTSAASEPASAEAATSKTVPATSLSTPDENGGSVATGAVQAWAIVVVLLLISAALLYSFSRRNES